MLRPSETSSARTGIVCLLLAAAFISTSAICAESRVIQPGEPVEPREVTRLLSVRPVSAHDLPRTRTIGKAPDAAASAPSVIALRIQFGFDSATLPPQTLKQLDSIATGLQALPASARVLVEGHTDAIGTDAYNDALSRRRAETVRNYLISRGLTPGQLEARGEGSRTPLVAQPQAAENRRVEFRRLD